ncbi:MAG TPA: PEP-CTERM sorting domain-containing protein [Candidatus Solibacter sp.]|nr:PEP-CTERM sorting domain-containing protein [Candidatus Solibacter sp.]
MRRLFLLAILTSSTVWSAVVLTNSPAWNDSTSIGTWGDLSTPTYGETVTVPLDGNNLLSSFTFQIFTATAAIAFKGYVQNWDGTKTTGSPLFTGSGTVTGTPGAHSYTMTPNVALTPGGVYMLYFSVLGISEAIHTSTPWGSTSSDTYTGGAFFFSNVDSGSSASGSVADLNTAAWGIGTSISPSTPDLAFSATFTAPSAPEPGAVGLVLLGLTVLVSRVRRCGKPNPAVRRRA